LALASNGFVGALAQDRKQERTERQTVERTMIFQSDGQEGKFNVRVPDGMTGVWVNGGGAQQLGDGVFQFFSEGMSFDSRLVKGAPFSAETVSETIQTLPDGNRIVQRSEGHIYRDSLGRTRTERTFRMGGTSTERQTISIFDPESGPTLILDPQTRTARKVTSFLRVPPPPPPPPPAIAPSAPSVSGAEAPKKLNLSGGVLQGSAIRKVQPAYPPIAKAAQAEGAVQVQVSINEIGEVAGAQVVSGHPLLREAALDAARQWQFKPTELGGQPVKVQGVLTFNFTLQKNETAPQGGGAAAGFGFGGVMMRTNTKTETLGKQTIEGIECEGKRSVSTIPAGEIGNERTIEMIRESWYSPELQMTILTKQTDPRFGESTYRVTNINRSEPEASLFQVPNDYTIREGGSFSFSGDGFSFGEAEGIMKKRRPPQQ
jgi:TonB family protein